MGLRFRGGSERLALAGFRKLNNLLRERLTNRVIAAGRCVRRVRSGGALPCPRWRPRGKRKRWCGLALPKVNRGLSHMNAGPAATSRACWRRPTARLAQDEEHAPPVIGLGGSCSASRGTRVWAIWSALRGSI